MSEMGDVAAVAIAEAKNLESLWLARCKLITDMGIARIAIGCRKLRLLCLKWCLRIGDLGVGLVALKCKEIRTLDLSYLPLIMVQELRSKLEQLETLFSRLRSSKILMTFVKRGGLGVRDRGDVSNHENDSSREAY
ncbi:hypothetical protein Patl1_06565 [Pistacia atlantica]|uniref:Uncharacterized protein n=1 Tax=Pistacia atlantica TaxID=434234 RepID=A0ACC1BW56_9ROSI|nr:hypothetical protein Patl1_06565 [Pistacia atlantica]